MSHRTYRTRVAPCPAADAALRDYAQLFSRVGRTLHARLEAHTRATGVLTSAGAFKNASLIEFGLTGRQFNAVATTVEGMRSAAVESRKLHLDSTSERIAQLDKTLSRLREELVKGRYNKDRTSRKALTVKQREAVLRDLHQKGRKHETQVRRLAAMRAEEDKGEISLCFGSRKLFKAQFNLEQNGYANHQEWLADWRATRASQFLVLGSKGETAGCQGCAAALCEDGSLSLRVRLPQALAREHGTHIELHGVRFAYGQAQVQAALASCDTRRESASGARSAAKKAGSKFSEKVLQGGAALTWRFLHSAKGWEVHVSLDVPAYERRSIAEAGRVAVDINADHLAVAETDLHGNCVAAFSVPCRTQGMSAQQAGAVIGDAVKRVVGHAGVVKKPLALEKLDFSQKKKGLASQQSARYARMLSSFAYSRTQQGIQARAADAGLEVNHVNPAFTSVIGRVKYSVPLGITTHEAAAVAIARRSQGAHERAPQPGRAMALPVKGGVTAWEAPDWMLPQHRAHPWRRIARALPGLGKQGSARKTPAAAASGTRKRTRAAAGEAGTSPPAHF